MVNDYNTQGKKQQLAVKMNQNQKIKDMENNIKSSINSLNNEVLNLKEFFIKNLQNDIKKTKTEM